MDVVIGGIAVGPVIALLIQFLKAKGLSSEKVPFVNLAFSTVASLLLLVVNQDPTLTPWVVLVIQMVIAFTTANSAYSTTLWAKQTELGTKAWNK